MSEARGAAPVSGDTRGRASALVKELTFLWCTRDPCPPEMLDEIATAALALQSAEGRKTAMEAAMRRLTQIYVNETPTGMTPAQAANWAMGIACDEIRTLADTPGEDGIDG